MNKDYTTAIHAAIHAGRAILEVYEQEDLKVDMKPDETPLTLADRTAHSLITETLKETGIPVLSEEGSQVPYDTRKDWAEFWLVDPLDGTKEFISRNGEFTVNIALVREGQPVFGVVYAPVLDELYVGIPGFGSYRCIEEKYFLQPIDYLMQFSERLPLGADDPLHLRVVASRSHYNEETRRFIETLAPEGKEINLVNRGSSLKLCLVASGEADIYPRLGPTMEWDVAAAHAVVAGAGKRVVQFSSGEDLHYNKEELLNPYFVAR